MFGGIFIEKKSFAGFAVPNSVAEINERAEQLQNSEIEPGSVGQKISECGARKCSKERNRPTERI